MKYSSLTPAGDSAQTIFGMMGWIFTGALIIWILFIALMVYAVRVRPGPHDPQKTRLFIIGGGTLFPVLVISVSIFFSLRPLPQLLSPPPTGSLQIKVSGAQWWWRVKYLLPGGEEVQGANEVWLPVGEPVQLLLSSEDVIHSFWVPSLAGKMDMIPGRTNSLTFTPQKVGEYSGVCAEYCGASHAKMRLDVKVVPRNEFDQWLASQKSAVAPSHSEGERAFVANGCVACHTVRGLDSRGTVGPDLTHVGSRKSLGAGIVPNNVRSLSHWLQNVGSIKPEVKMPNYDLLPEREVQAISTWLEGLR